MAEVLDQLPSASTGRSVSYPWGEWMDGKARKLVRGEDFDCSPKSMRCMAYAKSKKAGKHLKTRTSPEEPTALWIQFVDKEAVSE
jgi:hypothetical protein